MTDSLFRDSLAAGAGQVAVWSQLLDRINVFPVADGDTGRNLVVSLAPLKQQFSGAEKLCQSLLLSARGNSGNIAAQFLSELAPLESLKDMPGAIQRGRDRAYAAVGDPQPGTMLSLFDRLAELCAHAPDGPDPAWTTETLACLEQAVAETMLGQPVLEQAGVVDAGALGMYLFCDGFFTCLAGMNLFFSLERASFKDRLCIAAQFQRKTAAGYCIDAVLESDKNLEQGLIPDADSAVVLRSGGYVKVHFHAPDREQAKAGLSSLGHIVSWSDDDLAAQTGAFAQTAPTAGVHIMTDAAGSLTREDAAGLGVTLLESFITLGDKCLPETCFAPQEVYCAMREGKGCSTAQASNAERWQRYKAALDLHPGIVYLCVGSAYTGNFDTACQWQQEHDPGNRLTVIDTGAASGRLALAVHLAARFARQGKIAAEVAAFARSLITRCHEYIFLDTLKYLAAGGRMSKTGAFFGDMLKLKPVISPQPEGAQKVGMVRNRDEQIRFALEKLQEALPPHTSGLILLQYSDNPGFVEEAAAAVQERFPRAELLMRPLSLTTGVHTGPGTWAVAFAAPE